MSKTSRTPYTKNNVKETCERCGNLTSKYSLQNCHFRKIMRYANPRTHSLRQPAYLWNRSAARLRQLRRVTDGRTDGGIAVLLSACLRRGHKNYQWETMSHNMYSRHTETDRDREREREREKQRSRPTGSCMPSGLMTLTVSCPRPALNVSTVNDLSTPTTPPTGSIPAHNNYQQPYCYTQLYFTTRSAQPCIPPG